MNTTKTFQKMLLIPFITLYLELGSKAICTQKKSFKKDVINIPTDLKHVLNTELQHNLHVD